MELAVTRIGPYTLANRVILAPMAGVTDLPFRRLCRRLGAGLVVSEMVTADTRLWNSRKSRQRLDHTGENEPRSVQIAGGDALMMADAARCNEQLGAQIIDINMGCPAKKVCNKAAGSALMRDEKLVAEILEAVVAAVNLPVTLKIRTGWCAEQRNGLQIARIAEQSGIQALAVHGRTRTQLYTGSAEYDSIALIKQNLTIPVFANGDIDSPEKAKAVLDYTGADAVMIGRAAQGKPWIFNQINHYLEHRQHLPEPGLDWQRDILLEHLDALHVFYGQEHGARIARKHVGWYLQTLPGATEFRRQFNRIDCARQQRLSIQNFFTRLLAGDLAA
ncbi:MAG: tRNA dihydrouridine synthase DusB [Pseudomonas sp.]